jgi:hypothetical protein
VVSDILALIGLIARRHDDPHSYGLTHRLKEPGALRRPNLTKGRQ